MSEAPIIVTVRLSCGSYVCRHKGVTASCAEGAGRAAQRLAEKLYGMGSHLVTEIGDGKYQIIRWPT